MATTTTTRRRLLGSGVALAALGGLGARAMFAADEENTATMDRNVAQLDTPLRGVDQVLGSDAEHWVGDGFRVRSVISPTGDRRTQSPFLLLDHAPPRHFAPAAQRRGVGEHPHRGFETVTFAYRGEIEHRDSAGGGGLIGPGDIQWMTAAGGLVHEEMHSRRFTAQGGEMEMVQLWVNLPAKHKRDAPKYQALLDRDFPRLQLGAAQGRLIAGALGKERGPANTHTPMTIFDLRFDEAGESEFVLPSGFTTLSFSLEGEVKVGADDRHVPAGRMALLERQSHGQVRIRGERGARVLVLSGEPIDEPVAAYGPFVMNTRDELVDAVNDFKLGRMGRL